MTTTKERPILFSGQMVRALLSGQKTQTRRVLKPQPTHFNPVGVPRRARPDSGPSDVVHCPYGQPGDGRREAPSREVHGCRAGAHPLGRAARALQPEAGGACAGCGAVVNSSHRVGGSRLWVRETWAAPHAYDHLPPRLIPQDARFHYAASEDRGGLMWRPSIHMPRWASRITLEITEVRVERLQGISDEDLAAEGIQGLIDAGVDHDGTPRDTYRVLWESINGPGSWDANPWVWGIAFKVIS